MIKKIESNFDFVHLRSFTLRRFSPGRFSSFWQKYLSALNTLILRVRFLHLFGQVSFHHFLYYYYLGKGEALKIKRVYNTLETHWLSFAFFLRKKLNYRQIERNLSVLLIHNLLSLLT